MTDLNFISTALHRWISFKNFQIIYDSEFNELSCREINTKIQGKKNISIFIQTTDNYVFGTFHQNTIKTSVDHFYSRHLQEGGYFLFTIRNPLNIKPTQFVPSKLNDYLVVYSNDNQNSLIGMCNAFDLKCSKCTISSDFPYYYITDYPSSIFVGKTSPQTFELERITVVQWKE